MENLELQRQELTPRRNGDEQKFVVALVGGKIGESPLEELKQALRYVMVKIGLRAQNWPSDEEKQILMAHIADNFKYHSVEEIKLAFDLAIGGKLDIDDVNCYENFSCMYFSKIMIAYRKWSAQAEVQIRREDERRKMNEIFEPKQLTDAEYQELLDQVKIDVVDRMMGYDLIPEMLYDWLDRTDRIQLTLEKKKGYFQKAISVKFAKYNADALNDMGNSMKRQILEQFRKQRDLNEFSKYETASLKAISKKMAVHDFVLISSTKNEPGE